MKTTTPIRTILEFRIMEWAINAELFEDVENRELSGWSSWDRTGVLTSKRLIIDWDTPHIASYSKLILRRLRGLRGLREHHTRDIYAQAARDLEARIRDANKGLLSIPKTKQFKTAAAHG